MADGESVQTWICAKEIEENSTIDAGKRYRDTMDYETEDNRVV